MSRYFLGLDSSTQSLSAVVIDLDDRLVVADVSLNFDQVLPHYGTRDGVFRAADPTVIHASPLQWVEALDLMFMRLRESGVALDRVVAVSGSGQQHGRSGCRRGGDGFGGVRAIHGTADPQIRPRRARCVCRNHAHRPRQFFPVFRSVGTSCTD